MGAPSVSLKQIIERVRKSLDQSALAHSIEFYIPTLATALASFGLFGLLVKSGAVDLNAAEALLMIAVVVSLVVSAWIQFVVYKLVDQLEYPDANHQGAAIGKALTIGTITAVVLSGCGVLAVRYYFGSSFHVPVSELVAYVALAALYAGTWVQLSAVWGAGHNRRPAMLFVLSYGTVFMLSYVLSTVDRHYFMWGYVIGIANLFISLCVVSARLFGRTRAEVSWWKTSVALWGLLSRNKWGMLFQTFFVLAIFLDKIVVWLAEGAKNGTGLQIVGPYTTGSFLGFIPTFGMVASAYYSERLKRASKGMYEGTLSSIRTKTAAYKQLYRSAVTSTMAVGLVFLVGVVMVAAYVIKDLEVIMIATTVGGAVVMFQAMVSNSALLSVFGKNHISALSMMAICAGEIASAFFVSYNTWFAAVGFFVGTFVGLLISHTFTMRFISRFEYNAFRAFQSQS